MKCFFVPPCHLSNITPSLLQSISCFICRTNYNFNSIFDTHFACFFL
nr:MAG TPA: hypothetical protein [Caudoviricetes sp.]